MGYLHIQNLYKDQRILYFRECYAMEKIHGTSAHVSHDASGIHFFSGGASHEQFKALFNEADLTAKFCALGCASDGVTVFGEAYGGKMQGMSGTYGKDLKFIAFDVKIGDNWLDVPNARDVAVKLGLDFVCFEKIPATLEAIQEAMLKPSDQAIRNGCGTDKLREGVVCRPLIEVTLNNGERVIVKHKNDLFKETATKRAPTDKREVLAEAEKIADEWVTEMRLTHVLDKVCAAKNGAGLGMEDTGEVIKAMIEDVYREAGDEIVQSKDATRAIGGRAAKLYKERVKRESGL